MKHYIQDRNGRNYIIEENGWEDGYIYLSVYSGICYCKEHKLKMHYRHERTWDDHMGNTPCGYYAIVPIGKERKRIYLNLYG